MHAPEGFRVPASVPLKHTVGAFELCCKTLTQGGDGGEGNMGGMLMRMAERRLEWECS